MEPYKIMAVWCDLSDAALICAAEELPASKVYTLYVHKERVLEARNLCRRLAAQTIDNPLSPYINILTDPDFKRGEWCLKTTCGVAIGSPTF